MCLQQNYTMRLDSFSYLQYASAMEPVLNTPETQSPPVKKSLKKFLLLSLLGIGIVFLMLLQVFFPTKKNNKLNNNENLSAYERVQKEQEERNRAFKISVEPLKKRLATGKHTIHIVFFKPPAVSESDVQPLVNKLQDPQDTIFKECNNGDCYNNASFFYIKTFLQSEAKKYKQKDVSIQIKVHPLANLTDLEKIGDFVNIWGKDAFGVTKLQDAFKKGLKDNNISIGKNDLTMFLYFDNTYDYVPNADERFYEHKKFRSFADPDYGRAYINIYNFSASFSGTAVEIVTHELLHLFGANDKYLEYSETDACDEKGLGEMHKKPLYPQKTGDIMCLYVEHIKGDFTRGHLVDKELVINELTAKEIGWVK